MKRFVPNRLPQTTRRLSGARGPRPHHHATTSAPLAAIWLVWHGDATASPAAQLTPVPAGTALVIGVAVRSGRNGSRIPVAEGVTDDGPAPDSRTVHHDDDHHWRAGGMLYANRQDPALLVPKRLGIGWTVNFGNPRVLLLVALIAAFPVAMNLMTR